MVNLTDQDDLYVMPTSYAQQRMWLLKELEGDHSHYNIVSALKLEGHLNIDALKKSIERIVIRHEVLRTFFASIDEEPMQIVQENLGGLIEKIWLHNTLYEGNLDQRWHEALMQSEQLAQTQFSLNHWPLMKVVLFDLGENQYLLTAVMHHIITDGWSMALFAAELTAGYRQAMGLSSVIEPLEIQYADYALWQREWLEGGQLDRQLTFWRDQLSDIPPMLLLASDFPRPAIKQYKGDTIERTLDFEMAAQLRQFQQRGISLYVTLLTAYHVLLHLYSGQHRVVVGSPVANRTQKELEPLIGLFVNTLVHPAQIDRELTFNQLLETAQSEVLARLDHQDVPFDRLVEELQVERNLGATPIFQAFFVLQNQQQHKVSLPELSVEPIAVNTHKSMFDLTLAACEDTNGIDLQWEYDTSLFLPATMTRMADTFTHLLKLMLEQPDTPLRALQLISDRDLEIVHQQLISPLPIDAKDPYRNAGFMAHIFQQVQRNGDVLAVVCGEDQVTYQELWSYSDKLACLFMESGIEVGDRVAIALTPSVDMMIAILAAIKVRAVYVPIDNQYPESRIKLLLESSLPRLVVSTTEQLDSLSRCIDASEKQYYQLLGIDRGFLDDIALDQPVFKVLNSEGQSEDLLYIIFTSGSTGVPKGARVTHRGFNNLLAWFVEQHQFGPSDKTLLISSPSFDLSQKNLFAPLMVGGQLHLLPGGYDPVLIRHQVAQQNITWLNSAPSAFYPIIEAHNDETHDRIVEQLQSLKYVFLGGEPIRLSLLDRWRRHELTQAQCVNTYGPTECTDICASFCLPNPANDLNQDSVPIGLPIPGANLFVLDEFGAQVPVGVIGELAIGGEGLGEGYIGKDYEPDAKLNQAKFVTIEAEGEQAVYLSGDRVRLNHLGLLEFVGRKDSSVKIRGFRVDPQEVETCLESFPGLEQVVVVSYQPEDRKGSQELELVAYVVPSIPIKEDEKAPLISRIRQFLVDRLPFYLVPRYFMVLEHIPLNAHGKLDKQNLPEPSARYESAYQAPRTTLEHLLVNCWQSLLAVEPIGINQDFFQLGGHSLLAVKVINRLGPLLAQDYPHHGLVMRDLFEASTIEKLAERIQQRQQRALNETEISVDKPLSLTSMVQQTSPQNKENIPLTFAQQRLWFIDQYLGPSAIYNMPLVMLIEGPLEQDKMALAMTTLIERHLSLRTCFEQPPGKEPVQKIIAPWPVEIPFNDLSLQQPSPEPSDDLVQNYVQAELQQLFDLSSVPLWRTRLLKLADNKHIWIVVCHHGIADGESLQILMHEFTLLYNQQFMESDAVVDLPSIPLHYNDYARWQRSPAYQQQMERHLHYWQQQLLGIPELSTLPTDYARTTQRHRGQLYRFDVDEATVAELERYAASQKSTLFNLLLTSYFIVLNRYASQDDFVVGVPTLGRDYPEIASTVGLFVNALPIRVKGLNQLTFNEAYSCVQQTLLDAYDHQSVSFDQIVAGLKLEPSQYHEPVFQVMFSFQQKMEVAPELLGLSVSPLEGQRNTAKYDLTLAIEPSHHSQGYQLNLEYDQDLYAHNTVVKFAQRYHQLLRDIAAMPTDEALQQTPVGHWPLESVDIQSNELETFAATHTDYPQSSTLSDQFSIQVSKRPDAIAIVCDQVSLSYQELDLRSDYLAAQLERAGLRRGDFIGLYLERSIEQVVAMLAVVKLGAAYVPIDLSYPLERIRYMLVDSHARLLITQKACLKDVEALQYEEAFKSVLKLKTVEELLANIDNHVTEFKPVDSSANSSSLAYVIYTSGSTGKPKGVQVSHKAVLRLVLETNYINITPDDCVAQASNTAFDAATFEIWGALLNGARMTIVPRDIVLSPLDYSEFLRIHQISILFLTTALFNQILREREDAFACLRVLLFGGEQVDPHWVRVALTKGKPKQLVHVYGPTENTTFSTYYEIERVADNALTIPIGRAIANTQCFVLDEHGQLVPSGIPGELYLGGDGLAEGYLNLAETTEEKFVSLVLPGIGRQRLYKTGDLVRVNSQGDIEFIGRMDQQVKIRGLRVELGEIHLALLKYEGVDAAYVMVSEDSQGTTQIIAYIQPSIDDLPLSTKSIRQFLKGLLPNFMIPAVMVFIEQLPLNANGKVDKHLLPKPEDQLAESNHLQPISVTEERVYNVWATVLPVNPFSTDDDFFELGGHSLMATQVISRLNELFSVTLSVRHLFENPTVVGLAHRIDQIEQMNQSLFDHVQSDKKSSHDTEDEREIVEF